MPLSQRQFQAIVTYANKAYQQPTEKERNILYLKALKRLDAITTPLQPWKKKLSTDEAKTILCFHEFLQCQPYSKEKHDVFLQQICQNLNDHFKPTFPYTYDANKKPSDLRHFYDVHIKNRATLLGLFLLTAISLSFIPGFYLFVGIGLGSLGAGLLVTRAHTTKTRSNQLSKGITHSISPSTKPHIASLPPARTTWGKFFKPPVPPVTPKHDPSAQPTAYRA